MGAPDSDAPPDPAPGPRPGPPCACRSSRCVLAAPSSRCGPLGHPHLLLSRLRLPRLTRGEQSRGWTVTTALDAGVPLRDVQDAARHAGPRTTMRYDRGHGPWTSTPPTSSPSSYRRLPLITSAYGRYRVAVTSAPAGYRGPWSEGEPAREESEAQRHVRRLGDSREGPGASVADAVGLPVGRPTPPGDATVTLSAGTTARSCILPRRMATGMRGPSPPRGPVFEFERLCPAPAPSLSSG